MSLATKLPIFAHNHLNRTGTPVSGRYAPSRVPLGFPLRGNQQNSILRPTNYTTPTPFWLKTS